MAATRQEFIDTLGAKLAEGMSTAEVLSQIQYYQGYIDGEMLRGKTEEAVLEELGDPMLIAKTILESPREEDPFAAMPEDEEAAYNEGTYAGVNQKSPEDVKAQMEAAREAVSEQYRAAMERAEMHKAEREAGLGSEEAKDPGDAERVSGKVDRGGIMRDANGDFNWGLAAVILAVVMIIVAFVWFVGKVVSSLGIWALVIVAVIIIISTLRKSGKK